MSFIDASYFVGDLDIPNPGNPDIAERITLFIQKYEPIFLEKLFGYALYKAFVAGVTVVPPAVVDPRLVSLLYGTEYTDFNGALRKWKGLIITDTPVLNMSGNLVYKAPAYVTAGTTPGFVAGASSATLDGTAGTDDWRGYVPIVTRSTIIKPGVDYSWDPVLGIFQLLKVGDKFGALEQFVFQFQARTDQVPSTGITTNESLIANYIYYQYRKANITQYTGIGEVIIGAENAANVSPRRKLTNVWNDMHDWVCEFLYFMKVQENGNPLVYPEWTYQNRCEAARYFGFINPIF